MALPTPMLGLIGCSLKPSPGRRCRLWRPWDRKASMLNPCPDIPDTVQGKGEASRLIRAEGLQALVTAILLLWSCGGQCSSLLVC